MKVKALKYMAGLYVERIPGKVYDIPKPEALRLIAAGFAEEVTQAPKRGRKPKQKAK